MTDFPGLGKAGHHQRFCPTCEGRVEMFFDPTMKRTPQAGDLALCVYCSEPFYYTDIATRHLTREELLQWDRNPHREKMVELTKQARKAGWS